MKDTKKRTRYESNTEFRDISSQIASAMKTWRIEKGFTEAAMAQAIGVSQSSIHRYENEPLKIPAYIVQRYCEVLQIDLDQVIKIRRGKDLPE